MNKCIRKIKSLTIEDNRLSKISNLMKKLNSNRNIIVINELKKDEEILQKRLKYERKKNKKCKLANLALHKSKKSKAKEKENLEQEKENLEQESQNKDRDEQFYDEVTEDKFEESYIEECEYDIDNFED